MQQRSPSRLENRAGGPVPCCTRPRLRHALVSTTSLTTLSLTTLLIGGLPALATETIWRPAVTSTVTASDSRETLGSLELFMPALQNESSVFYLDLRLDPAHIADFRGSYGAGIRHVVDKNLMLGGYVYYNNESVYGTPFEGATIGAEFLTRHWDGHVNYHFDFSSAATQGTSGTTLSLVGNDLLAIISDATRVPLEGIDAEVGYTFRDIGAKGNSLRIAAGAYHYFDDASDLDFSGVKTSAEFEHKFTDSPYSPRLTIGGELRHDNYSGTGYSVQARLRIPLGGDGFFSGPHGGDISTGSLHDDGEGLTNERLNERVRVTGIVAVDRDLSRNVVPIDPNTGNAIGQFFFADDANNAGGTGTFDDPTTLANAISGAGSDGFVVGLENGLPANINSGGVTLLSGQSLLGGGTDVPVLVDGVAMTFTLPGSAGTIEGTGPNAIVNLADDNIIRNLAFTGGGHGIAGNGVANGMIDNVTLRTTGDNAIRLENMTGAQTISNFTIDGTGDDGIFLDAVSMVTISNGTIDNTPDQGIDVRDSNADITSVSIGTANANSIGNQGIIIVNGANVRTVNVTNVTIGSATAGVTDHVGAEALSANSTGAGKLSLNLSGNNILRSSGPALSTLSGGAADNLEIAFGNLNVEAGTLVPAIDIQGSQINATTMSTVVRSAGTITVDGNGTGGGIRFNAVRFDADAGTAGDQQVAFGAMTIGSSGNRVQGDGLSFLAPTGDVQLASLDIFNNLGTGLEVDTKIGGTTFNLDTLGGSVDTTNGAALFLDPLTGNINFSSVSSTNATNLGATSQISSGNGSGVTVDGLTSSNSSPALSIGTLTVTNPGTAGILINDSADIAFGASTITLATANTQGIDFQSTSGDVSFGVTTINGVGSDSGQTGVDFNGATLGGMVDFASIAISGPSTSTDSIGVDLTGVQGNQNVNLGSQANPSGGPSSSISGLHRGVVIDSTAAVQFTFGDGENGSDTGSSIDVNGQSGAFTVDAGGGTLPASTFDFSDVTFGTGDSANFPAAPSRVIFVSTLGGNVSAGTNGLSQDVTTITVTAAEALSDNDQVFVFVGDSVGGIDVAGGGTDGFTLLAGQSIDSFNDGNAITFGTIQPSNITGNFGVTGGTITADDVTATNSTGAASTVVTSAGGGMIENFDIASTGSGIAIVGASTATTVSNVAIDGQGGTGTGLFINSNAAAITVNDVDITATGNGLREVNGTSAGSVTVDAASSIGATSINALTVENSAGDFTMNGTINETDGAGSGVAIDTATGTIAFNGALTLNTGASDGIRIGNSANMTVTFDTGLVDIDTTNGSGFNLFNNTGTTISFLNGFDIDTGTGTGITANGSQTIRTVDPTGTVADVTSASGTAINLNGTTIAAGGMQFSNISAGGSTNGIVISNVSGGMFSVSAGGTVNVSGSSGDGIVIQNSDANFDFGSSSSAVTTIVTSAGGNGVTLDTNTGTIDFGNLTISGSISSGLAVTDNTGAITIADATVDGSTQWGVRLANNSGAFDIQGGAIGATTSNGVGFQVNGGSGDVTLGADITQTATGGGAVQINGRSTGTVRVYGDITANTGGSDAIQVFTSTGGTVTFDTGVLDLDTTNGTAIHLLNNAGAAINFLNGFDIDTTTGAGFRATGGGIVRVVDPAGAVAADVTTAGGMAIDLNSITVDANGMAFSAVSATGGSTGIAIDTVSGGAISFDTVSITNPSTAGIDISNAIGSVLSFGDIDIALDSDNTTAFDLSGATIDANLMANDFDVTSSSATGTVGIDLTGTTGSGIIRIGDPIVSGESATINGVAQGVLFSSATLLDFTYGDGEGSTDTGSSIVATTSIAHDGSGLPSGGNYNFLDVNASVGDYANISGPTYFVFDNQGVSGAGTFSNPGTALEAENATVDVLFMIDTTLNNSADTIDLVNQGVSVLNLDDGQVLIGLKAGESIDVATLGATGAGGAPSSFQFTGITSSTIIAAPSTGIDDELPVLLAVSGVAVSFDGVGSISNAVIRSDAGTAIQMQNATDGRIILSDIDVAATGGDGIDISPSGGTLQLALSGITASGDSQAIRITGSGITVTEFSDITVPGLSAGVLVSGGVTFDADPVTGAIEGVNAGNWSLGSNGSRIVGDGLRLDGVLGRVDFGTLDIYNDGGTGLYVRDDAGKGGTFTLTNTGGSIDTTNGTAIDIDPVSTDLTFATVSSTNAGAAGGLLIDTVTGIGGSSNALTITNLSVTGSGANGVTVRNSSGNYTFTNTTISGATGDSVSVFGGSSVLNFSGGTITHDVGNAAAAVSVAGGHTGSLTFSGGINATTGTGLQFDNADGTSYSFNGAVMLNGGDAGVDIVNGSDAAFTFSNLAITDPTGTAFNIDSSNITALTLGGSITQNNAASAFVSYASTGGIHNIGANITANTGTANAVAISSTGTFNFTGGLDIETTSGTGFRATGGGTLNVTGAGNVIGTTTGRVFWLGSVTIGGSGVTFASLTSSGTVASAHGIQLSNVSGGTFNGGNVTIAGTSGGGTSGIYIGGSSATFNFDSATVDGVVGSGIYIDTVAGPVTVTTVDLDGGANGLRIANSGNVNINGGTIGATTSHTDNAVNISGGSGTIAIAADVTNTNGTRAVQISGRSAGSTTLTGTVTTSGSSGGIAVSSNSGGSVDFQGNLSLIGASTNVSVSNNTGGSYTFSGGTKTINTSSGTASGVLLSNNGGATINFTNGGLDIDTTSGAGFTATGGGTVTVQGTGNTVTTGTGTAVTINNTTIGAAGVTFRSVSANGAASGIILANTGTAGAFAVTGTGTTAGSGGAIQNTTSDGVSLTNVTGVSLANMTIANAGRHGIFGSGVTDLDLTGLVITGSGDAADEDGIHIENLIGTGGQASRFQNIQVLQSDGDNGIRILQTSAVNGELFIDGASVIEDSREVAFEARTQAVGSSLDITIGNTSAVGVGDTVIIDNALQGVAFFAEQGSITATVRNSIIRNGGGSGAINRSGGSGTNGVLFVGVTGQSTASTSSINLTVTGNDIDHEDGGATGTGRVGVALGGGGNVNGTIQNNTIDSNDEFVRGIYTNFTGPGALADNRILIDSNAINLTGSGSNQTIAGIEIVAHDSSGGLSVTITNNTVNSAGANTFSAGIVASAGDSGGGDSNTLCVDIRNNASSAPAATGGGDDYTLVTFGGTILQVEGVPASPTVTDIKNTIVANNGGATTVNDVQPLFGSGSPGTFATSAGCP